MPKVGCCIDNGPIKGFWGLLRSEIYYSSNFNNYDSLNKVVRILFIITRKGIKND